jgi:hypothetical protein
LSEPEKFFFKQLAFSKQPQLHLKAFYNGWLDAFYAYDISNITGSFDMLNEQEKKLQRREALGEYRRVEQQIAERRTAMSEESAFNKKIDINVQIKKLQDQLNKASEKL